MMYADLKAARETIEELKQEKGFFSVSAYACDIFCRYFRWIEQNVVLR